MVILQNNKKYFAIIFLLMIICSCEKRNIIDRNQIDIFSKPDSDIVNLSSIATDIIYIPLQTLEESVIPTILDIKCNSVSIIIHTFTDLLFFNKSGSFLYKVSRQGRGPEEYIRLIDFDISEGNDTLLVLTNGKILLYLLTDSGYVFSKSIHMPVDGPSQIDLLSDRRNILLTYNNQDWDKPFRNLIIDFNGDTLNSRLNNYTYNKTKGPIAVIRNENIRYYYAKTPHFKEVYNDTIYTIDQFNNFKPYLILYTHKRALKTRDRAKEKELDINKFVRFLNIFEVNRYIFYGYTYKESNHSVIYDKKLNIKFELNNKINLRDDIIGGVSFLPRFCCDEIMFSWINAAMLKNYVSGESFKESIVKYPEKKKELEILASNLKETDNPILILVKLKE
jgi:hypothetical protein